MRVLVAGATGAIGRQLVPLLTAAGHTPIAMVRAGGRRPPPGTCVEWVEADALDDAAVSRAVRDSRPDAIVNMLTAIPAKLDPRKLARDFAPTNRLWTEGTRNLYAAARSAG